MVNLFIRNFPYSVGEPELQELFMNYGAIERVSVARDRETGQSRGFGFVEMTVHDEAMRAIESFDGTDFSARELFCPR